MTGQRHRPTRAAGRRPAPRLAGRHRRSGRWSGAAWVVLLVGDEHPVAADQRARHQHKREPPPRAPVPPHLQPPEAAQPRQRVGSGRGAVPPFRVVRFPGPHLRTGRASSPASGSPQARAGGLLLIIIRSPSMALGSARPGSGSGSPSRARSAAAPLCRGSATTLVGSGGVATPNSLVGACGAAIAGPGSR